MYVDKITSDHMDHLNEFELRHAVIKGRIRSLKKKVMGATDEAVIEGGKRKIAELKKEIEILKPRL